MEAFATAVEPHFLLGQSVKLNITSAIPVSKLLTSLNYRITRNPAHITDHVRKILLLKAYKLDSELVFAALIDLFVVLKKGGIPIRKRMLFFCKNSLPEEKFNQLRNKLDSGDISYNESWINKAPTLLPDESRSGNFITQTHSNENEQTASQTPYDLANEYIQNSQLQLAISTLEKALQTDPVDEESAKLLTHLYRSLSDNSRFSQIYSIVKKKAGSQLCSCWQDTAQFFSERTVADIE